MRTNNPTRGLVTRSGHNPIIIKGRTCLNCFNLKAIKPLPYMELFIGCDKTCLTRNDKPITFREEDLELAVTRNLLKSKAQKCFAFKTMDDK